MRALGRPQLECDAKGDSHPVGTRKAKWSQTACRPRHTRREPVDGSANKQEPQDLRARKSGRAVHGNLKEVSLGVDFCSIAIHQTDSVTASSWQDTLPISSNTRRPVAQKKDRAAQQDTNRGKFGAKGVNEARPKKFLWVPVESCSLEPMTSFMSIVGRPELGL